VFLGTGLGRCSENRVRVRTRTLCRNAVAPMKIDYDTIAGRYDRYRVGGGPYETRLVELARAVGAQRVLEIGPGTGNNTAHFVARYPCRLVGLELSLGMLIEAKAKGVPARWVQGSALEIPLAERSVDFVFGVYVLHHIEDVDRVFRECARVLGRGAAIFLTASTRFIERHPMNRYFPSFAAIDKARFQPVEELLGALETAGFDHIGCDRFVDAPKPIDRAYADKVADKFVSTYELIPPGEFAEGLARLYADVDAKGCLDEQIVWESVGVWGYRDSS